MYKLFAIWSAPAEADQAAFEEHYRTVHLPLAAKVPHIRRLVSTSTAQGRGDAPAPFFRISELIFDSLEELQASMASPQWAELGADTGAIIERFGNEVQVALGEEIEHAL